ncbi:hypothetical protein NQ314_020183 [Rhamnusium bicolor]|uniref:TROVE domain-containing protein n=1 Tax=Rhamnusium bicolor TaxID=1586634 RepID=A0AAV8WLX8_9CUCU|nr:hypothetical protein NQ314_020183 [Rhamnusium bicolor]
MFIWAGSINPKYISGGPDKYKPPTKAKQDLLDEFVKNSSKDLLDLIISVNEDKLIPYRATLYSILACALNSEAITDKIKPEITATVLKICKSDEEFFDFIKYITTLRQKKCKFSTSVGKTVRQFYNRKTALDLVHSYAKYKGYHSWTHKDLIKLGHVNTKATLKGVVVSYILKKEIIEYEPATEAQQLLDTLKKAELLRRTSDHILAVSIIPDMKATINQVEPCLRKSAEVWNAVLPNMSLSEVLRSLPKLYKLGFLKRDTPTQILINGFLTNAEKNKGKRNSSDRSMYSYEKLRKRKLDPKFVEHLEKDMKLTDEEIRKKYPAEAKCPIIINNLQKCMTVACSNVQPLGKRYMVTIDVTDKRDIGCLHNKNITGLEAAVAFTMALLKVEKNVTVAVYKDRDIVVGQFYEHVQKLRQHNSLFLTPSASIVWASTQKKHIDIFYNFIHHKEYHVTIPINHRDKIIKPAVALERYRKKLNLPNTKLISFCMSSPHLTFANGSQNLLDVAGLDTGVPKAVEAFCRGNFC